MQLDRSRIEVEQEPLSTEERKSAYELCFATRFEEYLGVKKGSASPGLDGAESLIPGMKFMVDKATNSASRILSLACPIVEGSTSWSTS